MGWQICALLTKLLGQDGIDEGEPSSGFFSFVSWNELSAATALDKTASTLLTLRTASTLSFEWHGFLVSSFLQRLLSINQKYILKHC